MDIDVYMVAKREDDCSLRSRIMTAALPNIADDALESFTFDLLSTSGYKLDALAKTHGLVRCEPMMIVGC